MFSVIVCSEQTRCLFENEYQSFLKPFLGQSGFAFCTWNIQGQSLEEMLPDLAELIANKSRWRVFVVADGVTFGNDFINRKNPFDVVEHYPRSIKTVFNPYVSDEKKKKTLELLQAEVDGHRQGKSACWSRALENPLTKLLFWLEGAEEFYDFSAPEKYRELIDADFVSMEDYVAKAELLNTTVNEIEEYRTIIQRNQMIREHFQEGASVVNKPQSVFLIAERNKPLENIRGVTEAESNEFLYSDFYDDNLYCSTTKYLLYDVPYENEKQDRFSYLSFLLYVLIIAQNDFKTSLFQPYRVYRGSLKLDNDRIKDTCHHYIAKLKATIDELDGKIVKTKRLAKVPIPREESIAAFESEAHVEVAVSYEVNTDELYAKYDKVGLSKDCPIDEYHYWYNQYVNIGKSFNRYLREPQRALKSAVKGDFRSNNYIDNPDVVRLNENQLEDVQYKLEEEELNMVKTSTVELYNTKKFKDELAQADKELRRHISRRMTKRVTIICGVIAIAAYLLGFLPLLFSALNTVASWSGSLLIIGICIGLFAATGGLYLFVLKKKLINRFIHFNYVMAGILNRIENAMKAFGRYLSHACNVMREYSVIESKKNYANKEAKIYEYHKHQLKGKINETYDLLFACLDGDDAFYCEEEPYCRDFKLKREYDYEIPFAEENRTIYLFGNEEATTLPVDFVSGLTWEREDLYD